MSHTTKGCGTGQKDFFARKTQVLRHDFLPVCSANLTQSEGSQTHCSEQTRPWSAGIARLFLFDPDQFTQR